MRFIHRVVYFLRGLFKAHLFYGKAYLIARFIYRAVNYCVVNLQRGYLSFGLFIARFIHGVVYL